MVKDRRYTSVHRLIEAGDIQTFKDIFIYIPKSVLARDLRRNYMTFAGKVLNPDRFTLLEFFNMSQWIGVEPERLVLLVKADVTAKIAKWKKPSRRKEK
jgi:hypothetical protein